MKETMRRALAPAGPLTAAAAIAAALMLGPSGAAAAVEYVKICSLYGYGFYYIPGTDTCLNAPAPPYSARVQTEYGTWAWTAPNNPRTWVSSPAEGCTNGQLVKLGDVTGSSLVINERGRLETSAHLSLPAGQYVSSVMYKGGLVGPATYLTSALPACPSPNAVVTDATDPTCTPGNTPVGTGTANAENTCEVTCVNGSWQFAPGGFSEYQVGDLPACPAPNAIVTDATDEACTQGDTPVGAGAPTYTCDVACVGGEWQYLHRFPGGVGNNGSFCMFYHYLYVPPQAPDYPYYVYVPFGCIDTAPHVNLPETLAFSPINPMPPSIDSAVDIRAVTGELHNGYVPSFVQGKLSIWVCLQDASDSGSSDSGSSRRRRWGR